MNPIFSLYRFVTEEEQLIFKQLIGDAFETEALLVSTLETESYTEYIFIYNHPTEEMNNLFSFYGKVKKKKSKELELLEFATAQLTEKMILRNVNDVENLEDFPIKAKVANSIKYDIPVLFNEEQIVLTTAASAVDYKTKSQATYYFDCDGEKGNSKGSFCCILQRLKYRKIEITEKGVNVKKLEEIDNPTNVIPFDENKSKETLPGYFILTAGHNLQNGKNEKTSTTKGSVYKLINDADNFVELELIKDYTNDGYDAAVLKINTPNITSNDFYVNAIKFNNNFITVTSNCESPDGTLVGYVSKSGVTNKFRSGESIAYKLKNGSKDEYEDDKNVTVGTTYHELFNPGGQSGDSGSCEFIIKENKEILDGVYRGKINREDCSNSVKLHGICVMYKDINRKDVESRVFLKNEYSLC